jgi:glycosyltransferase involved in cell wall biosynthesis
MTRTAAIYYSRDGYDTTGNRILGRQAAGEGFLRAIAKHGQSDRLYCYTGDEQEYVDFQQRVQSWTGKPPASEWIPWHNPAQLVDAGTLFLPGPGLGGHAWQRRWADQRAYSLCGVTHTTASQVAMQAIGELFTAPLQPWDALICTSQAVKTGVEHLLGNWGEYLAQRMGGTLKIDVQLPVIPLGIETDTFLQGAAAREARQQWRQRLEIAEDAITVLFVGRLIAHAKAHPVPMYIALEKAAKAIGKKLVLIQAGWFEFPEHERDFKQTAAAFCPSVTALFVDGRQPDVRTSIWCAADIFISLADNIQETFGLTPIEAMAAGLPVVVSDWNGYRETVRDRVDGYRIPTLLPSAGCGTEMMRLHFADLVNYSTYVGQAANSTAIDVEACVQALIELGRDGNLRHKLGENGRSRARSVYDWKVVIAAYEALWEDLARLRASATMNVYRTTATPHPLADDPFSAFAHYPTHTLTDDLVLSLGSMADDLTTVWNHEMNQVGHTLRLPLGAIEAVLRAIDRQGTVSVGVLIEEFSQYPREYLERTLVYLVKFAIVQCTVF